MLNVIFLTSKSKDIRAPPSFQAMFFPISTFYLISPKNITCKDARSSLAEMKIFDKFVKSKKRSPLALWNRHNKISQRIAVHYTCQAIRMITIELGRVPHPQTKATIPHR